MSIQNNANVSLPMILRMFTTGSISRTPAVVSNSMALKHRLRELNDGHPAASRYMDSTDDLHMPLRNIAYTDSPIGVALITLPHT